ncbi:hypothetical protein M378DRAFT_19163 [Amanita muscaria Koide BX008]|uniref:Uncharacterized protein n=1 Tax=Amanita muscaria (strain Koide BX008) TaxID=946122 RepID=A0A0C2VZ83_AMAMK|nr:hypothetical protein M378DRAFT_19284 [Amanita muscaria Koide BX008]KIL54152.1 hypothetical protein M378DRAFT_19163 [Amanita muscaria Koide BX008]
MGKKVTKGVASQLLTTLTQHNMENQNQALRNLLRDMETLRPTPLNWEETSFLDMATRSMATAVTSSSLNLFKLILTMEICHHFNHTKFCSADLPTVSPD